ncbi:hypothetical protein J3Q64DRAFT_1060557 [Phycomyces blakesleeanus]|uniref:Uncharacterized protein n=1 Tax=Phycomyces blakesleeanus TaxID=4837 RepID=A0ABR3BIT8_PHYBL
MPKDNHLQKSSRITKPRSVPKYAHYRLDPVVIRKTGGLLGNLFAQDWVNPGQIVRNLPEHRIRSTGPKDCLQLLSNCFEEIANTSSIPKPVATFASRCTLYLTTKQFERQFIDSYRGMRVELNESEYVKKRKNIIEKSKILSVDVTESCLDTLREDIKHDMEATNEACSTKNLRKDTDLDSKKGLCSEKKICNEELKEVEEDWWLNETSSGCTESNFIKRPSRDQFSPHKPKWTHAEVYRLQSSCIIAMNSTPTSLLPPDIINILESTRSDQFSCAALSKFPTLFNILKEILQYEQEGFPTKLWIEFNKASHWNTQERNLFQFICLTLTDFWGTCLQNIPQGDGERTFWCERVIPLFKYLGCTDNIVVFDWCEKMSNSHMASSLVPGVWQQGERRYMDGLGQTASQEEKIFMESSGGTSTENIDHVLGDSLKLVRLCTDALRAKIMDNRDASFSTAKKQEVYGVQCIVKTLTLTQASLYDKDKWLFLELRSAKLPSRWQEMPMWIKVFELMAQLYIGLLGQQVVEKTFQAECNQLLPVALTDSVRNMLRTSSLLG